MKGSWHFLYFIKRSKYWDNTQSFLGNVSSTKLPFRILFTGGFWWTEGSCCGLGNITRVAKNAKYASMQSISEA